MGRVWTAHPVPPPVPRACVPRARPAPACPARTAKQATGAFFPVPDGAEYCPVSRQQFATASHTRTYQLIIPTSLSMGDGAAPDILLLIHGSRQSSSVFRTFTDRMFENVGVPVLYPDGVAHHFNDMRADLPERTRAEGIDDVAFLTDLCRHVGAGRVFGVGFSNGAHMIMRLLRDAPGFLAGGALFAASRPAESNIVPPNPTASRPWCPTPLLFCHGTADPLAPYGGGVAGVAGRSRGVCLSARESAEFYARANGATECTVSAPAPHVSVRRWEGGSAPVELWSMEGAGHVIPGQRSRFPTLGEPCTEVHAARMVAEFFGIPAAARLPRPD